MAFLDRFKQKGKSSDKLEKSSAKRDILDVKNKVDSKIAPKKDSEKAVVKKTEKESKTPSIAYKVLVKPLVTEKAADLQVQNKYVFEVSVKANKITIAQAIEELYGVKPEGINIIRMRGKNVRYGRTRGTTKKWKKAIVTLKKGDSIQVYEGI